MKLKAESTAGYEPPYAVPSAALSKLTVDTLRETGLPPWSEVETAPLNARFLLALSLLSPITII